MKIENLEIYVLKALQEKKETRGDDFLLYLEVCSNFVDTSISLKSLFINHKDLKLPPMESVSRCRRKLQERDNTLKDNYIANIREAQQQEYIDYAMCDKVMY